MHNISIVKTYSTKINIIVNLFRNNSVFKFTSANDIQNDFKIGGVFRLSFENRGTIHGRYIRIIENEIVLEWNLEGFQRPPEIKTIVEISFKQENEFCTLTLNHSIIPSADSADAKRKAWTEILNEIETQIDKK